LKLKDKEIVMKKQMTLEEIWELLSNNHEADLYLVIETDQKIAFKIPNEIVENGFMSNLSDLFEIHELDCTVDMNDMKSTNNQQVEPSDIISSYGRPDGEILH
jgi:hypothetical protein